MSSGQTLMWFWKKKPNQNSHETAQTGRININAARIISDKSFPLFVVGESNYQGALRNLSRGHVKEGVKLEKLALLVPEPTNSFDKNAVLVMIDDKKVGYLSREDAIDFHKSMVCLNRQGEIAAVDAIIVGGFIKKDGSTAHFGVRLDVQLPLEK